jgi:hypothetical protein
MKMFNLDGVRLRAPARLCSQKKSVLITPGLEINLHDPRTLLNHHGVMHVMFHFIRMIFHCTVKMFRTKTRWLEL